jgi:Na+/H+-translocating membrane pyrophosphatase
VTRAPRNPIVIEFGLILGIDIAGLAFALLLGRSLGLGDAGSPAMRRLAGAIERAARAFLWREYRLVAVAAGVLVVGAIALNTATGPRPGALPRLENAFWTVVGVIAGAALASLTAHVATLFSLRSSVRAAAAANISMDKCLSGAMRASGAGSLVGETLSALGVASLFGAVYAVKGGFALPQAQSLELLARVVWLLPGFLVGAASAALIIQRGGGTYHAAAGIGADHAGERDAGLEHDDPKNPAVLSELVGDHVGAVATRAVDAFVSGTAANIAALVLGASMIRDAESNALALILLPLVVRAFGVIGSAFGMMLVRTNEAGSVAGALFRGYLSTVSVTLVGTAGTLFWVLGERWGSLTVACAAIAVAVGGAACALKFRLSRRSFVLTDASDSLRVDGGTAASAALGAGLQTVVLPMCLLAGAGLLAMRAGSGSDFRGAEAISLLTWTTTVLACSPYALAVGALGPSVDTARAIAAMTDSGGDAKRRIARVDDSGFIGSAVARQYLSLSSALSTLLAALALEHLTETALPSNYAASTSVVWCAALGACLVLAYSGGVARSATRVAREIAAEVERQLRGFPREHGVAKVPSDYTPSYKTCIDLAASASLKKLLAPALQSLLAPFALGFALKVLYRSTEPRLAISSLMWFVAASSITALGATLSVDATRTALGLVRRANRSREAAGGFGASISADALGDVFGNSAGPAAQLLVKATAGAALVLAPFLT